MRVHNQVHSLVFVALLAAMPALASEGGGGEGAGGGPLGVGPPPARAPAGAPARAPAGAEGTSTLPGGGQIVLSGPPGNRDVEVTAPGGKKYSGKHIRTSRNKQTGITSVWIRNADGSRTGVHVDQQGNSSVTNHKR